MLVAVISPPDDRQDEVPVLGALLGAGLARYHVRKPGWDGGRIEAWTAALPESWRPRLVLHGHPALARRLRLGGIHWRDDGHAPADPVGALRAAGTDQDPSGLDPALSPVLSRSCHRLDDLRKALGRYDSVFFGPLFPSISKPGHGPDPAIPGRKVAEILRSRRIRGIGSGGAAGPHRQTSVLALGGVCAERLAACRDLGFDGAAVLGAVWSEPDPVRAFTHILAEAGRLEGGRHAA